MTATLSYELKKALPMLTKEHRWDVLTVLILHANIRNRCWVSTDTICELATNGNRNKAIAAKKWLDKHMAFELVTYNKRVDEEKKLKPRQHVYQLLGKIDKCEDVTCDCQKLTGTVHYLYINSIDGETFKSLDGDTFKSIDGETRSIPTRTVPVEEKSANAPLPVAATNKITFPKALRSYTAEHICAYQALHATDMTGLVRAWRGDMYNSITEFSSKIGRQFIETHKELVRLNIPVEDYPLLCNITKKKDAWKDNPVVTDILAYTTDYKPKPPIDSGKPMAEWEYDLANILEQQKREEALYGRA